MNQKVPYLTRQIAYAFLVGLIAGGITMGLFDSYAKTPLFSSANAPHDGTYYCTQDPTCAQGQLYEFDNSNSFGEVTGYEINGQPGR